ncbi:MAG: aconitase X [Actinomycetota bacterium]
MPALSSSDRALLAGDGGEAARLAMSIIVEAASMTGARQLIDIDGAHIDGCLYHGRAGLDFAERLAGGRARVAVPTTLNVGALDLLHPGLYKGDARTGRAARRLMDLYVGMGCRPTWTCAPYQLPERPGLGRHVAWAESNAIVFANSVLGARTDRYGDFIDICAAITGRVPDAGLHRSENRAGGIVFRIAGIPDRLLAEDVFYPVLGHLVGARSGDLVPIIDGLPAAVDEDRLKALGAAAASSGAVAMFHAVGVTPEAHTLEEALAGRTSVPTVEVTPGALAAARDELTSTTETKLCAVSVGTPHFSAAEFKRLASMLDGFSPAPGVELYISTGRDVLEKAGASARSCEATGWQIVTDTCTYITPILRCGDGVVMTNSAKWAWYAPGNLGVDVAFGSLAECVRSASMGRVWRDDSLWA